MPKLPSYSAPAADININAGRRAAVTDFTSVDKEVTAAAHHLQASVLGHIEDMAAGETRTTVVKSAEIRAKYARELDDATLTGADLSAIKQRMTEELSQIGDGFQTKHGVQQVTLATANAEVMFDQQANSIAVARAKTDAEQAAHSFLVSEARTLQSNRGYLPVAEANAKALAETFTKVPLPVREKISQMLVNELHMGAAISDIRDNPVEARKRIEAGEYQLTPTQVSSALDKAHSQEMQMQAAEHYKKALEKEKRMEGATAAYDEVFKSIMNGTYNKNQVMNDPRFEVHPQYREHLALLANARAKELAGEERKSDPIVKRDMWLKVNSGQMFNNSEIVEAVRTGKLNTTDADKLNGMVAGLKDESGASFRARAGARIQIVNRAMMADPEFKNQAELAADMQNILLAGLERRAKEMRAANTSPDALLDETSKDYYFKPGLLREAASQAKQTRADTLKALAIPVKSAEDTLQVPDGKLFVDASGVPKMMTPGVRLQVQKAAKKVEADAPVFPIVPSGETPERQKYRTEEEYAKAYREWQKGIGK